MLSLDASNVEAIASLAANHFYGGLTHTRARRSVRRSTIVYSVLTTKRYIVSANRYRNEKKLPTLILSRFFQTFPPPPKGERSIARDSCTTTITKPAMLEVWCAESDSPLEKRRLA